MGIMADKMRAALDKKMEESFAREMAKALDGGVRIIPDREDNVPLETFNQVLKEQAKKKVN